MPKADTSAPGYILVFALLLLFANIPSKPLLLLIGIVVAAAAAIVFTPDLSAVRKKIVLAVVVVVMLVAEIWATMVRALLCLHFWHF